MNNFINLFTSTYLTLPFIDSAGAVDYLLSKVGPRSDGTGEMVMTNPVFVNVMEALDDGVLLTTFSG